MGRRPRLLHPSAVLGRAKYTGMKAIADILAPRTKRRQPEVFRSVMAMWKDVRDASKAQDGQRKDYLLLHETEPNLRKAFLQFLWESTIPYGNKEVKRVYDWTKGTVGPLNALLNYAGARLRDLAMTRYPFPEPAVFQVCKSPDGSVEVYPKALVDRLKAKGLYHRLHLDKDTGIKTYWRAGYSGTATTPQVYLSHPTLPSLDFIDMIRAHVYELCRQCFIHNVPRTEAHRYIRLLIHRLRPFLDWYYTEGAAGRPHFNRHGNRELRAIIVELRALYGRRAGHRPSMTQFLDEPSPVSVEQLRKTVAERAGLTEDENERERYHVILNHIDEGRVVDRDVEKLFEQVRALSSQEGNRWHRVLLSDLHHPRSLRQVVFAGERMLDRPSSVLAVAELPVQKGHGQVDLVVFLRRKLAGRPIWTPVMVLEVKTKNAFDFNLYGTPVGTKTRSAYAPAFFAWRRAIDDDEWTAFLNSLPSERTFAQLASYEEGILQEYRENVDFDPNPPTSLWRGVVVLDVDQSPQELFPEFHTLIEHVVTGLSSRAFKSPDTVTPYILSKEDGGQSPHLALVLLLAPGPEHLLSEIADPTEPCVEDPFTERVVDDRLLTLYVSVPSPTSSGVTAAWTSRNWHLLHHIKECQEMASEPVEVYWVDLLGDFQTEQLINLRFGLDALLAEKLISWKEHRELLSVTGGITFVDVHTHVDRLLQGEGDSIDALATAISDTVDTKAEKIVIIDGWDELSAMLPSYSQHLLRALEVRLLESLPTTDTNVIWLDRGSEHTLMSAEYQRGCISPLRHDSPRRRHLDEIIYNLPTPPRVFGNLSPWQENVRVIVQDTPTTAPPWRTTVQVPHLIGAAQRFRGAFSSHGAMTREDLARLKVTRSRMHGRGITLSSIQSGLDTLTQDTLESLMDRACGLVPTLFRPRGEQEAVEEVSESTADVLVQEDVPSMSGGSKGMLQLQVNRPPPVPPRSKESYVPANEITRRWYYERDPTPRPKEDDRPRVLRRPPIPSQAIGESLDTPRVRRQEVRRLLSTTRFLAKRPVDTTLKKVCTRISELCVNTLSRSGKGDEHDGSRYLDTLQMIQEHILAAPALAPLWESLRPAREGLLDLLNTANRTTLKEVREKNPDVLLLYGSNLFLMVCAAAQETGTAYHEALWAAVAEWTLYQLGLRSRDTSNTSKYDLHAIYSNLLSRARTLSRLGIPDNILSIASTGQVIWWEAGDLTNALVVFPDEDRQMVAGMITGHHEFVLLPTWYRCAIDQNTVSECIRRALESEERWTIMMTTVSDHKVLWVQGTEDATWYPYLFEYGTPDRTRRTIPWFRLTDPFTLPVLPFDRLVLPQPDQGVRQAIGRYLHELGQLSQEVTPVRVTVSADRVRAVYVLVFEGEDISEKEEFSTTRELLAVLRYPLRKGMPYKTGGGLVTWDHRRDILYEEDTLSWLLPLVQKSRFLPGRYTFPQTCRELLALSAGASVKLHVRVDGHHNRLGLEVEGVSEDSPLRALEHGSLSLYELGLLAECHQLIDTENGLVHKVELEVSELLSVGGGLGVTRHPALVRALAAVDRESFDWTRGSWALQWRYLWREDALSWSIINLSTGREWLSQSHTYRPDPTCDLDSVLKEFREEVAELVPPACLNSFEDTMAELREELMSRGWGDTPPTCRGEVYEDDGEYILTINRVERDGTLKKLESMRFAREEVEGILEAMDDDGIELWPYNLENEAEIQEALQAIQEGAEPDDEAKQEDKGVMQEYEETIAAYQEEALEAPDQKKYFAQTLVNYAEAHIARGHHEEALQHLEEGVGLLRTEDMRSIIVLGTLARGLVLRASCQAQLNSKQTQKIIDDLREAIELVGVLNRRGRTDTANKLTSQIETMKKWADDLSQ